MDPALASAISAIAGAVTMLIVAATAYYFPRGRTRFDPPPTIRRRRRLDEYDEYEEPE